MYNWERRAAENLTNAEHMRDVRRKIDHEYQEQLRRRERERADAEVKREIHRVRTPSPPAPPSNRFKTRSYDRPWAQGVPVTRKQLSYTVKPSTARLSLNKGSVSRLPAICRGTQGRATELANSSKTPWRANVPLASQCKEQSLPWQKQKSVDLNTSKLSTHGRPSALKQTQSQDTLRVKNKIKAPCNRLERPNIAFRRIPESTLDSHSLPQTLTSPGRYNTDWLHLPSLQCRPPSPEDKYDLQTISHAFEGFSSDDGSVVEVGIISEDTYRGELSRSSADSRSSSSVLRSISTECPSSSGTLESPLNDPFVASLSNRFRNLDILSSDSDGEDSDLPYSWQASVRESYYTPLQWTGSQTTSNDTRCGRNTVSPQSVQFQQGTELSTPVLSVTASLSGRHSPMTSLIQVGQVSVSHLAAVTERGHQGTLTTPEQTDQYLPELELSPRRSPPSWPGSERSFEASPRASLPRGPSLLGNRPQETRDAGSDSVEETPSSSEAFRSGTSGLMDHLSMALMALHDIRREVAHMQVLHAQEGNGSVAQEAQSAPATNPETLRRIKESLLEESSDEEGDQCRICQSGAESPTNPLLTPCQCSGSLQYIHHDCLKKWIQTKIQSGTTLSAVKTCELCKEALKLDLDNFDVDEFYQSHNQSQVDEDSPELYMLLLLQQRFSEVLQMAQTRRNAVSQIWRQPLIHRMTRARVNQAPRPQSSLSNTADSDT